MRLVLQLRVECDAPDNMSQDELVNGLREIVEEAKAEKNCTLECFATVDGVIVINENHP